MVRKIRLVEVVLLGVCGALLFGCNEQEFSSQSMNSIAIATGDFDDISESMDRMLINHTIYDGIISTATWDPDYESMNMALQVETLLGSSLEMRKHDSVFLSSGMRGVGEFQYNGVLEDDFFVSDSHIISNVYDYVASGHTVLLTDWTYEILEWAWPDAVDFLYKDESIDRAQLGVLEDVTARVTDDLLADALGMDSIAIHFNYSNWAVMESVSSDVTVWLRGDISYREDDAIGDTMLTDVPLLVSLRPFDGAGRVVFSSFHMNAQNDYIADQILRTVVGPFQEGFSEL